MLFGDVGVVYGQSVTYTCDPGFEETELRRERWSSFIVVLGSA